MSLSPTSVFGKLGKCMWRLRIHVMNPFVLFTVASAWFRVTFFIDMWWGIGIHVRRLCQLCIFCFAQVQVSKVSHFDTMCYTWPDSSLISTHYESNPPRAHPQIFIICLLSIITIYIRKLKILIKYTEYVKYVEHFEVAVLNCKTVQILQSILKRILYV